MNAVEIEEAISQLAEAPFDAENFPYTFLEAFGNKETTIKRLRKGESNKSDLGGVLQTNNIHIATCAKGAVTKTLMALRMSPATPKAKAKFILATDGADFEAEDLVSGETVACSYNDFPDHFGFFLPLAGISTVKQISENAFDIRATSRLNRLYVELLKNNPDWDSDERRHDMNHFLTRVIFCFFAEDTDIFPGSSLFTSTVGRMSERDSSNTHEVIRSLFHAMNTKVEDRAAAHVPRWADAFPYVNGGLFSGSLDAPRFNKVARSYLLHIGNLDWKKINPDIFGSMIQAVTEDEERGALGMHYTSMPNILKVLNPLFLDDLHAKLQDAGGNARKLLNLRERMSRIRLFDPACGSGNFLVIAYKEMRAIEAQINERRGEANRRSEIPLTNFRGIELRDFPAEVARLALIIAEFQCDVLYRGQKEALAEVLPLDAQSWITCGNALRIDWLSICPPTGAGVKFRGDDLFSKPLDQAEIDFENEGGETYICGNPPYLGSRLQTEQHKDDLKQIAANRITKWRSLDYIAGWFLKAADYLRTTDSSFAFVSTSSICEGLHVEVLWPHIIDERFQIVFAHRPFSWANLAKNNAGVTVIVVGVSGAYWKREKIIFDGEMQRAASNIGPYLINAPTLFIGARSTALSAIPEMLTGNMPRDGGHLILSQKEREQLCTKSPEAQEFIRRYIGTEELVKGLQRYCLWIEDEQLDNAMRIPEISKRLALVSKMRADSPLESTKAYSSQPHRFVFRSGIGLVSTIVVGGASSENRSFLPVGIAGRDAVVSNLALALYDAPLWNFALIVSRVHLRWIATICGKLKTDFRYSNTLGWNTFPVPMLTEKMKTDLTRCAEDILLAREHHFPATIADLYEPEGMPTDLRAAHDLNDEAVERIYIGRRFKNDTERLEKLFDLYTKMTAGQGTAKRQKTRADA